jgi:hydrogenase nickel incorporation protein HypB
MSKFHPDGIEPEAAVEHSDQAGSAQIAVFQAISAENDLRAEANRHAFEANRVRALNLMSSPGSGKTTVLAATLDELGDQLAFGVIEGDIATDLDAVKLAGRGAQISLINTGDGFGGACHLDASMVGQALARIDLPQVDVVIVENVGNLVCPAEFDVGEHARVMVYSVTEGDDKPFKYPLMFHAADVVLLNKIDLLPYLDVTIESCRDALRQVNPAAVLLPISARTGAGMPAWFDWIRSFAATRSP